MISESPESTSSFFERLIVLHGARLKWYALRLTKNKDSAEDLYQDTLVRIFSNMDKMHDESNFYNWAMRVMYRVFLDKVRYDARRPSTTSFDELSQALGHEVDFADPKVDVESEVMLDMVEMLNSRQLRKMISTLEPKQCEIVSLNTYGTSTPIGSVHYPMEYEKIAQTMNIPSGTVKSRINRAKKALSTLAKTSDYKLFE